MAAGETPKLKQNEGSKDSWFWIGVRAVDSFIERLDLKIASKLALAAILSLYMSYAFNYYFKHPDYFIADLWCVMTSIIVLQTTIGGTYKAIWFRFLGILIGSLFGAVFVDMWGAGMASFGSAIFTTVVFCAILNIPDSYRLAALSVVVVMLPWKAHPEHSAWTYAYFRFIDTCFGFIAALIISHLLWPSLALNKIRKKMSERIGLFMQYFALMRTPQNQEEDQKSSRELHEEIEQTAVIGRNVIEESKIELIMRENLLSTWIDLVKCQEFIWDSLRVMHNVYGSKLEEVFDEELRKQVSEAFDLIDSALKDISDLLQGKKSEFDFSVLDQLQHHLNQQLVRFRATRRIKNYGLDVVEDYFVFFYELNQMIGRLQTFHALLVSLNGGNSAAPVESLSKIFP